MSMDDMRGMRKAKSNGNMDCTADFEIVVQLLFIWYSYTIQKTMCGMAMSAIILPVCKTSITCEVVVVQFVLISYEIAWHCSSSRLGGDVLLIMPVSPNQSLLILNGYVVRTSHLCHLFICKPFPSPHPALNVTLIQKA